MNDLIIQNLKDNILRITLNNYSVQNTLSLDVINDLKKIMTKADNNKDIKVIIFASTGNVFSAGHNLKEINFHRNDNDKGLEFFKNLIHNCSELMLKIIQNSKPVIAEVNGIATAAGCQLVATCDLAYSSNISQFATPGVNIGLFCSTPMVALSRTIKQKHAMEMLLTGDLIDAEKAKDIGLIGHVVPDGQALAKAMEIAEMIANNGPLAVEAILKTLHETSGMTEKEALDYEYDYGWAVFASEDAKEGPKAWDGYDSSDF